MYLFPLNHEQKQKKRKKFFSHTTGKKISEPDNANHQRAIGNIALTTYKNHRCYTYY